MKMTDALPVAIWTLSALLGTSSGLSQTISPLDAPVPLWESGRPMPKGGPVYLSEDRHEIIVSIQGKAGNPPRVIRVPLWNNIVPTLGESLESFREGTIRYTFTVGDDVSATDGIGTWAVLISPRAITQLNPFGPQLPDKVWRGAQSGTVVTVDQAALGRTEPGRYLRWFPATDSDVISPGKTLAGFGVDSSSLPGFTTAWFASGKLVEFDRSWPAAVFKQLEKLQDKKWREVYLAAIGPVFTAADPPPMIAQNYMAGIRAWIESGRLRAASQFVSESMTALNRIFESQAEDRRIQAEPVTADERLVFRAMQLSLGIRSGKE